LEGTGNSPAEFLITNSWGTQSRDNIKLLVPYMKNSKDGFSKYHQITFCWGKAGLHICYVQGEHRLVEDEGGLFVRFWGGLD
jgi:hypothetical protein